ncbi:MAG: hypothetical protein J5858_08250 [Lentisphaeria bacterium]|nr:hypothetical protein [Lentisphaeria bacterium]
MTLSVHNSQSELTVTPEMITAAGYESRVFTGQNGDTLPYRLLVGNADLPGKFSLMIFFHGAGSVGDDNFLQMRIPGLPFVRYVRKHHLKTVLLFPQCRKDCQWVDVPWNSLSHDLPETPSRHMLLAMELLRSAVAEFQPDRRKIYAGGISMGGYGAWDIVCRMPETFSAILAICGGADLKKAPGLRHLRVCDFHGAQDVTVPTSRSRDMMKALRESGCRQILYRELPDAAHTTWDAAFADETALNFIFKPEE